MVLRKILIIEKQKKLIKSLERLGIDKAIDDKNLGEKNLEKNRGFLGGLFVLKQLITL